LFWFLESAGEDGSKGVKGGNRFLEGSNDIVRRRTLEAGGDDRFEGVILREAVSSGWVLIEEVTGFDNGSAFVDACPVGKRDRKDADFGSTNVGVVQKVSEMLKLAIFVGVDCAEVKGGS
jgi:hypothetical protein